MDNYFEAIALIHQGNYELAVEIAQSNLKPLISSIVLELKGLFRDSLKVASEISHEISEITAASKIVKSYAYWRISEFDLGLSSANEARMMLTTNDGKLAKNLISKSFNITGLIYWKIGNDLDIAKEYISKSLEIRETYEFEVERGYSINNLGNVFLKMKNFEEAYNHFSRAFELRENIGYLPGIAASNNSMGRYFDEQNSFEKALEYHKTCLSLWKKVGNKQFIAKTHRFIARTYSFMNERNLSRDHLLKSIKIFKSIPNEVDLVIAESMLKHN